MTEQVATVGRAVDSEFWSQVDEAHRATFGSCLSGTGCTPEHPCDACYARSGPHGLPAEG